MAQILLTVDLRAGGEMSEVLRIGLLGCGGIAKAHLRGWKALADKAEVAAVADADEQALARVQAELPGVAAYRDAIELVDKAPVDAVDICLPHHLHHAAILAAASAGRHILCEKPLCLDLVEAESIKNAVEAAGVTAMCAHNQLQWPALREAREILDSGRLGTPFFVRTLDCFRQRIPPGAPRSLGSWRADPQKAGGGEMLDTGYHPTYRLLYLAPAPVVAVNVLVSFADGTTGNIVTSWAFAMPSGSSAFQVVCEEGEVFGGATEIGVAFRGFPPTTRPVESVEPFTEEIKHFVQCLSEGSDPMSGLDSGIDALRLILAAYRSVREGVTVRLERPA
jgi:predicted dehydrogenase